MRKKGLLLGIMERRQLGDFDPVDDGIEFDLAGSVLSEGA